ncbi:MAG: hypothetical protein A3F46_00885 [Legionellales bacterium RIFCSPHIGHO2_12_FULL_42_9]|nr:MAG: hypothetical protein A3F46_00885 [Legionellales bacterium RIFCSPHIGHO2_12_FULL_42_9]
MMRHLDPITAVIFWVTLIFFCGLMGRYLAHCLNQPGVLGELLMGVFVGNLCYFFHCPLAVLLREGTAIFTLLGDVLSGVSWHDALHASLPASKNAQQVQAVLQSAQGIEWIKVAYALDIFSIPCALCKTA